MISAGTIAAYLTLDAANFNRGIGEALALLGNLCAAGIQNSGVLGSLGEAAGRTAGWFAGSLVGSLRDAVSGFRNTESAVSGTTAVMNQRVLSTAQSIESRILAFGNIAASAEQKSKSVAQAIESPLNQLKSSAYSIMSNVGSSLNSGLAAKKSAILSTAASIANSVTHTLKSVLRIASPSKVMRKIGEQTAEGLALGLDDMRPEVAKNAGLLAGAVSSRSYAAGTASAVGGESLSSLADRLDALISLLSGSEQTMQVDGRVFARLIKEYS